MLATLPLDLQRAKGGVEAVCVNLARTFSENKTCRFTWISFSAEIDRLRKINYSSNTTIYYLPFKFKWVQLIDYLFFNDLLKKLIKSTGPDIIHVHGASPVLLRLRGLTKNNIVVTQHGIMSEEVKHARGIAKRVKFIFKMYVEKYIFPRFINLIFISQYNHKLFPWSQKHRWWFLDNPIGKEFFESEQSERRSRSIIYVGWISALKNLMLLLKALHTMREKNMIYFLTVVGEFKESDYRSAILEYVQTNNLGSQVSFTGYLTQTEVRKELVRNEIFLLPSLQENLPVSIAEAMASGTVVLSSNVGAVSEMFVDGESGLLFESNNENDLVAKLTDIYTGTVKLEHIADAARKIAKSRYHPESVCKNMVNIYKSVLT